jgi:uncharacterized phiE125 gp8 family phage protein
MIIRAISKSTIMALTVEEIKDHLRVDSTYENDLIHALSQGVELQAENKTRRALSRTQYEITLDDFPSATDAIDLPFPPISTVTADVIITYFDETSGNSTTLPATCYTIDYKSEPGRVYPSYDNEWPEVWDVRNAVTITYYSGYSTCPEPIKTWMKLQIGAMYENREAMSITNLNSVPLARPFLDGILDPYILPEVY